MQIDFKLLNRGIGLVLFIMVACIGFTYLVKLKDPVFLRNCIEVSAVSNSQTDLFNQMPIELQYITNIKDKRTVIGISFVEAPEFSFTATEYLPNQNVFQSFSNTTEQSLGQRIGRFSLRTVYIYRSNNFVEDWEGERELRTAQIQFNDGDTLVTDIGKMLIFSDGINSELYNEEANYVEHNINALSSNFSSSSNNGVSLKRYTVNKDVKLLKLESPLLEATMDVMELKVGDVNYDEIAGMEYKKGSSFTIASDFISLQGRKTNYDVYDIQPKLYYENPEGTIDSIRHNNIIEKRYFDGMKDILSYLWERRAF